MRLRPVLLFSLLLPFLLVIEGCHGGASNVAERYVTASQHKDYKAMVDLTYKYQEEVDSIKANNPEALWSKLVGQYYEARIAGLSRQPGALQGMTENIAAMGGDPTQGVRSLPGLLPASARWSITESRSSGNDRTTVYVAVHYSDPPSSPVAGGGRLKETMVQLVIYDPTKMVLNVGQVDAADVYWPIPPLTTDEASIAIKTQTAASALYPYMLCSTQEAPLAGQMPFCDIGLPQNATPWLADYRKLYERNNFSLREFPDFNGRIVPFTPMTKTPGAQPPNSWTALLLSSDQHSWKFRLSDSADLSISGLSQEQGHAKATARLVHSGCTPACTIVREYWQAGMNSRILGYNMLFTVHWLGRYNEDSNGVEGGRWPIEEERTVEFSWDPGSLSWRVGKMTPMGEKF